MNTTTRKQTTSLVVGDVLIPSGLAIASVGESKRPNHTRIGVLNIRRRVVQMDWHNLETHVVGSTR